MTAAFDASPESPPGPARRPPPRWPWLAGLALVAGGLTLLWWPAPPDDALLGKPAPGFALPQIGDRKSVV